MEENTRERILLATLELFAERGISQTNLSEVARHAGVTRVTIYRYFPDKKKLTLEAFSRIEQVFQKGVDELDQNLEADWESIMKQIGEDLSALPPCDVIARSDELKRLYPDVYRSIQDIRVEILNKMFDRLSTIARRENILRKGLNRSLVQAIFWEIVVNFFENPRFKAIGLSDAELYNNITEIFLHGILETKAVESKR